MTCCIDGLSDRELGNMKLDHIQKTYNYPQMVGHRSELANALYEGCRREKATRFFFSTAAKQIDVSKEPSFVAVPRQGQATKIQADVLLAADGVKSETRVALLEKLGVRATVEDIRQACYRIMVKRNDLVHDPELLELVDSNRATRWIGEKRMIIGYPIADKSVFNISTAHPDANFAAAPSTTYTTRGSKSSMLSLYSDFCPKIRKLLEIVPEGEVCEWKLRVHQPLPTWFYGSTALIGDACHPTLPHLAQGAAKAIEYAAVLGVALSRLPESAPTAIERAFAAYEQVRKSRAETLVSLAAITGVQMRLGEGAAKEERNKMLATLKDKKGESPDKWADENTQKMIYGHDCVQAAHDQLDSTFHAVRASL